MRGLPALLPACRPLSVAVPGSARLQPGLASPCLALLSDAKRCLYLDWRKGYTYRTISRIPFILAMVSFPGGWAA